MKELMQLKELYLEEIKKINRKGELSPADAESAKKALEAIEKIDEICCDTDDWEDGHSEGMMKYSRNNFHNQAHMPMSRRYMPDIHTNDYMYNDGYDYSNRRGRDSMGRYVSRNSGETVEHMIRKLEDMKSTASDDRMMHAIDNAIRSLEAY